MYKYDSYEEFERVIVLGAGASIPYGFPSGYGLMVQARERLQDDSSGLRPTLRACGVAEDEIEAFEASLVETPAQSLDELVHYHEKLESVVKHIIAYLLLLAERKSHLDREIDAPAHLPNQSRYHWMELVLNWMLSPDGESGAKKDRFERQKTAFVTFNYDRSLEEYIRRTLDAAGREEQAVESVPIYHVFGKLGGFDGFCKPKDRIEYGEYPLPEVVSKAVEKIQILYEQTQDDEITDIREAREALGKAACVAFIGFGFHKFALQALEFDQRLTLNANKSQKAPFLSGTCLGMTLQDLQKVYNRSSGHLMSDKAGRLQANMEVRWHSMGRLFDMDAYRYFRQIPFLGESTGQERPEDARVDYSNMPGML